MSSDEFNTSSNRHFERNTIVTRNHKIADTVLSHRLMVIFP